MGWTPPPQGIGTAPLSRRYRAWRPTPIEGEQQIEHEAWVIAVLAGELHMTAEQIKELDIEEAKQLVIEHWSRPAAP